MNIHGWSVRALRRYSQNACDNFKPQLSVKCKTVRKKIVPYDNFTDQILLKAFIMYLAMTWLVTCFFFFFDRRKSELDFIQLERDMESKTVKKCVNKNIIDQVGMIGMKTGLWALICDYEFLQCKTISQHLRQLESKEDRKQTEVARKGRKTDEWIAHFSSMNAFRWHPSK
jgi:hypothetical protein